jgi:uncharacterized protein YdaU (DUF1376 family)
MLARVGHNSGTYGQMLKPVLPATTKGPKQRFPYFKFYPRDWLESTRDLSLEQRGAYIDLICILMEMEGHLADNDKWISHQMHVNPRKWRSVKMGLVEHEKIAIEDGQIVNDRCARELSSLMAQRQNISDSAVKRERTKRETPVELPGNIDENSKIINEINNALTTTVPLRARVLDLDSDLEEEKKEPPLIPLEGEKPKRTRASRGDRTRLAKDWTLDLEWRQRTKEKFGATDAQIDREAERFWRYWTSPDAKNPLKADWLGTWENWFDRAMERGIRVNGVASDEPSWKKHYNGVL